MKKLLLITFALIAFNGFAQDPFKDQKKSDETPTIDSIKINQDQKTLTKGKVLFLLEGREITMAELKDLEPDYVKSIRVVKDKDEMVKFTSKDYAGLVIIKLIKTNITAW